MDFLQKTIRNLTSALNVGSLQLQSKFTPTDSLNKSPWLPREVKTLALSWRLHTILFNVVSFPDPRSRQRGSVELEQMSGNETNIGSALALLQADWHKTSNIL